MTLVLESRASVKEKEASAFAQSSRGGAAQCLHATHCLSRRLFGPKELLVPAAAALEPAVSVLTSAPQEPAAPPTPSEALIGGQTGARPQVPLAEAVLARKNSPGHNR